MSFRAFGATLWFISALVLLYVLISAVSGDVASLPMLGRMLTGSHLVERITPILILILFAWVLFQLLLAHLQVDREVAANKMFEAETRNLVSSDLSPGPMNTRGATRALRRLELIRDRQSKGDMRSLNEALPAAAALDASALSTSYVPLNVYAWVLPVMGFIGTASGMAAAIGGFRDALRPGAGQIETQLAATLSQNVIPGLSAAFEITMLALAAALVAYLCTSVVRNRDQESLDRLDLLSATFLHTHAQAPDRDDTQVLVALEKISEQLNALIKTPAALEEMSQAVNAAVSALGTAGIELGSAAIVSRSAAEALTTASKELLEASRNEYEVTLKRVPRS